MLKKKQKKINSKMLFKLFHFSFFAASIYLLYNIVSNNTKFDFSFFMFSL